MDNITRNLTDNKWFWLAGSLVLSSLNVSPAAALASGAVLSLCIGNGALGFTGKASKYFLQTAVVLLGFGLQIGTVLRVGASSAWLTGTGIVFTMTTGLLLSRLLKVERELSFLISGGTAICGGSAIAALAPAIGASQANTAMALAVVFTLNAVALLVFPHIGHLFGLSQSSYGLWAAMAIHDTSSVVGAAAAYGASALAIATTVKLTRALWILPLSFVCAKARRTNVSAPVPWFLFGFLTAALVGSLLPAAKPLWHMLGITGRHAMSGALFLVGGGLTVKDLRRAGARPLLNGILLWLLVSCVSLAAIIRFNLHP